MIVDHFCMGGCAKKLLTVEGNYLYDTQVTTVERGTTCRPRFENFNSDPRGEVIEKKKKKHIMLYCGDT